MLAKPLAAAFSATLLLAFGGTADPLSAQSSERDLRRLWDQARKEAYAAYKAGDAEGAYESYARALEIAEGFPETDGRRLKSLQSLAFQASRMDRHREAIGLFERDLAIRRQMSDRAYLGRSFSSLLELYRSVGETAAAEELLRERIARHEKSGWAFAGYAHGDLLALAALIHRIREGDPESRELIDRAAGLVDRIEHEPWRKMASVGYRYREIGLDDLAIDSLEGALEILRASGKEDRYRDAGYHLRLSGYYLEAQLLEPAERHARDGLALQKERLGEVHPDQVRFLEQLAEVLLAQERLDEAESMMVAAIAIADAAWGARTPGLFHLRRHLAKIRAARGDEEPDAVLQASSHGLRKSGLCCPHRQRIRELREAGRPAEARELAEMQLAEMEERAGPSSLAVAEALDILGTLTWEPDTATSAEYHKRELAILVETVGIADPRVAQAASGLGYLRSVLGQSELAEQAHLLRVESLVAGEVPRASIADALEDLGNTRRKLGKNEQALEDFLVAADAFAEVSGEQAPEVFELRRSAAFASIALGRYDQAEEILLDQVELLESAEPAMPRLLDYALSALARLYGDLGDERRKAAVEDRRSQLRNR